MMWTALCAGAAIFAGLSCAAGAMRRVCPDAGAAALRVLGASGMFALAIAAAAGGMVLAAVVAGISGVALTLDLFVVWRRLIPRLPRAHASTVTPFQNATESVIGSAASLGGTTRHWR